MALTWEKWKELYEREPPSGEGDMMKAVYDADDDGRVDAANHATAADTANHAATASNATTATTASKLATACNVALSGGVTGSAAFDGGSDINIGTTIPNNSITPSMLDRAYEETGRIGATLWSGTWNVGDNPVNVPNIQSYTVLIILSSTTGMFCTRSGSVIVGGTIVDNSANQTVFSVRASVAGNTVTITRCQSAVYTFGGTISASTQRSVSRIIGIL